MAAIQVSGAKDYRKRIKALAARHHYTVEQTRGGHLKLSKPGRKPIFAAYSPSDHRALKNVAAFIRKNERSTP